jgi:maleate cis-trans isomerase
VHDEDIGNLDPVAITERLGNAKLPTGCDALFASCTNLLPSDP